MRSLKRLFKFLMKKTRHVKFNNLGIYTQRSIYIPSKKKNQLTPAFQQPISIPAFLPQLAISKATVIDIFPAQPEPSYHLYVREAIKLMYAKAPDKLTPEEWDQFRAYHSWKKSKGEAIEEDIVYKPRPS